jgi:predicted negative regulator of RcsB-dependent stress response
MKKLLNNEHGIGHILAFVAVAVIVAVGLVGYRVMQNDSTGSTVTTSSSHAVPKTIKTKADVQKASKALDSTAIDGAVNPNELDNDLNSLL